MAFILKRAQTGLGHIGEAVEGVRNLIWDDMIFCHVFIFLFFLYAFFFGCEYSLFILKKYIRVVSLCLLTMNDQVSRAHRRVFSTDLRTSSPPPLAVVPGKPTFDGPVRKRTIDIHIIAIFLSNELSWTWLSCSSDYFHWIFQYLHDKIAFFLTGFL